MEIRHLRTMIAVAEQGSFGAAARVVSLTQSAVSQQIKALETELQLSLFDRSVRPPALTVHGRILVERGAQLVGRHDDLVNTIAGDRLAGTLVLGCMRSSLTGVLPKALAVLRDRYPRLRIRVTTGQAVDLAAQVAGGRLDAAIVQNATAEGTDLEWLPFAVEPLMVIAPAGTVGGSDKEILESLPYVRFRRDVPIAQTIDEEIRRRNIAVVEEMQIDAFAAIMLMVSHGLGAAVVPRPAVEKPLPDNIVSVPFGQPPIKRVIGLVEKAGNPKAQLVEALHMESCRLSSPAEFVRDFGKVWREERGGRRN